MTPGFFRKYVTLYVCIKYAIIFNQIIQYLHQTTKIPLKLVFLELTRLPILEPLAFVYVPDSNNGSNNIDKLRKMQTAYYFSLLFSRKISDKKIQFRKRKSKYLLECTRNSHISREVSWLLALIITTLMFIICLHL